MRALILVAALTATAPTPEEQHDANAHRCENFSTPAERRVTACSWLIEFGRLSRVRQAEAFYSRGTMHSELGRHDRAISDFDAAIKLTLNFANAYHARGMAYENTGMFDHALRDYGEAVRLVPDFASALNSKAWLLATAPDAKIRNGAVSVRVAQRAVLLVDFPTHHATLAAAYAEAGDFAEAIRAQQMAIARLQATGQVLSIPEYQSRLELYRAGRPYRR